MRMLFVLMWVVILALMLFAMWRGWRSLARRDANVRGSETAPSGELLGQFGGERAGERAVQYVSTTPEGEPLSRVSAPGLRYRGPAEITVREDGVSIEVDGEQPVYLASGQVLGTAAAGRRVGKAVESGGLALLRWDPQSGSDSARISDDQGSSEAPRLLESSFRFASRGEQERFDSVIAQLAQNN